MDFSFEGALIVSSRATFEMASGNFECDALSRHHAAEKLDLYLQDLAESGDIRSLFSLG